MRQQERYQEARIYGGARGESTLCTCYLLNHVSTEGPGVSQRFVLGTC